MKNIKQILIATGVIVTLSSYVIISQVVNDQEKNAILQAMNINYLENLFYNKVAIDDDFSVKAYDLYMNRLDYNKRFFLQSDVKELSSYKKKIDDEINSEGLNFYTRANEIMKLRLAEVKAFYPSLLEKPFDFSVDDEIETDHEKRDYAKSKNDLSKIWKKDLKYQTLGRLNRKIIAQEKLLSDPDTTIDEKSIAELEVEAREGVKKNMDNFFTRLDKINEKDRITLYLNSIINVFGPHTSYFPPADKERFNIQMSGKFEGIGARLSQAGNEIKVVNIIPGSPASFEGHLKAGDIISWVAQGADEPVNVEEMRLDEAVKLIKGPKGTEVRLTVTHKNGREEIVSIIRDVVILEETFAKSYILQDGNSKVGYIDLPGFYADFNDPNGRNCAKDVEIELQKLKKENVAGIILDLRNNGGGSLQAVVDMVGLFIDKGPVVQVRQRDNELKVMADNRAGIIYAGPFVVLVNEYSASASEILAAAIQDYERGIIIGSTSTFGKGTVQRFFDLDRALSGQFEEYKPLGAIKITTQKFYRINGGATQLKGVEPDIILPDLYSYVKTGERELKFPMPWDKINKADYSVWEPKWNEDQIVTRTINRVANDDFYVSIDKMAKELKSNANNTTIDLQLEKYQAYQKKLTKQSDDFEELFKPIGGFSVGNIGSDIEAMHGDSIKLRLNDNRIKNIEKDKYVYQSVLVIKQMYKPSTAKAQQINGMNDK